MLEIIWKANYKLLKHGNSDGYIASEARSLCKAVMIHISSHLIYMVAIASATKRQEKRCPMSLRDKKSGRKISYFLQITLSATYLYTFSITWYVKEWYGI